MPARIVKQPNGLLGRFSTIVDDFTHINMTHDEAIEVCLQDMGRCDAEEKVKRGEDDKPIWGDEKPDPDGLMRWKSSLDTIMAIHGKKRFYVRRRECTEKPKTPAFPAADS